MVGIHPVPGKSIDNVLEAAATRERLSEHPVGKAIMARVSTMTLASREPEQFRYVPGKIA